MLNKFANFGMKLRKMLRTEDQRVEVIEMNDNSIGASISDENSTDSAILENRSIDTAILELLVLSDSAISELLNLRNDSRLSFSVKDQVNHLLLDLRFINLYTQCLAKLYEALQDAEESLFQESGILDIKAALREAMKGLHSTGIKALQTQDFQDWGSLTSKLLEKVQFCKLKIWDNLGLFLECSSFLECSLRYKFSSSELQKFQSYLSHSLNDLLTLKADTIPEVSIEIQGMKERLQLLMHILELNQSMDNNNKDVEELKILIQTWLYHTACLSFWYWINDGKQEITELDKKMILSTPRITNMFLVILKRLWSSSQNQLLMHEDALKFADFFLEFLQLHLFKNDIETLHSGLIFLTTFLVDPPLAEDANSSPKEVESLTCSLNANELKQASAEVDNPFLENMNRVIAEVRKIYAGSFQDLSSFNFPTTNFLGFLDSVLENLGGISEHSKNQEVVIVQKELQSLRPSLETILELQKENLEIEDLWTRIVNVVYQAEIVIQLVLYVNSSIWYELCFLDVIDEIKHLKSEIKKIQDEEIYHIKVPVAEKYTSPAQANKPKIDGEIIGFDNESKTIIDDLIAGSAALNIVSIFGMAGLGKTTLAKKIYDHPSVQRHFHKCAWCYISQTYQTKKLILEILSGIMPGDFTHKAEEELEQLLRKGLLGNKYLIVMDDIWDLGAWNALKSSLPDQRNGSRIIFTSRHENVALKAKEGCILHHLQPLPFDESLELLKRKLFDKEDFPSNLVVIGQQIAKDCNGLPLAIVVLAGILSKKVDDLDWWNHIAKSIDSCTNDGCVDILELSYKHLPEYLKPCFLYFGAFPRGKVIKARKLTQLWISEGFIQKSKEKNLEDVAKEYLMDLVARSLVIMAYKSSNGGIKTCRIHDLLHTFCLNRGRKENFLEVGSWAEASHNSTGEVYKNYRICFPSREDDSELRSGPCVHSLLFRTADYPSFDAVDFFSICNFKLLHVLDMEDFIFRGYFREEVVLLVHLKYFAVHYTHKGFLSIPPSIASLRYLETFRLRADTQEIYFPITIWTMERLRHIDVNALIASVSSDSEPQESLVLGNIQTFSTPFLCNGEAAEKLLKRISNVQKLKCYFCDLCKTCNKFAGYPHCEEELRCHCDDSFEASNQFPGFELLSRLETLNVRYHGQLYRPCALMSFPSTLKKLTLRHFRLPWSQISTIAKLPHLEVLKLLESAFDGKSWDLQDDEFPKLKCLELRDMNIEEWNITCDGPFPCLEKLIVDHCYYLEEIPYLFAELIQTLRTIEVRWGKRAVAHSARQIQEDFEHVEVIIRGIDD